MRMLMFGALRGKCIARTAPRRFPTIFREHVLYLSIYLETLLVSLDRHLETVETLTAINMTINYHALFFTIPPPLDTNHVPVPKETHFSPEIHSRQPFISFSWRGRG